jgi:hypothetical protein
MRKSPSGGHCCPQFCSHVGKILVPSLSEGDIVVMDKLPAHKSATR